MRTWRRIRLLTDGLQASLLSSTTRLLTTLASPSTDSERFMPALAKEPRRLLLLRRILCSTRATKCLRSASAAGKFPQKLALRLFIRQSRRAIASSTLLQPMVMKLRLVRASRGQLMKVSFAERTYSSLRSFGTHSTVPSMLKSDCKSR